MLTEQPTTNALLNKSEACCLFNEILYITKLFQHAVSRGFREYHLFIKAARLFMAVFRTFLCRKPVHPSSNPVVPSDCLLQL